MLPILIDENFDHRIIRGLRLRLSQLDYLNIVPEQLEIGRAIADLEIFIECSSAADMENQIQYLPL